MPTLYVAEGSVDNIIPLSGSWPGFLMEYGDNYGRFNFDGTNLLFTPTHAGGTLFGSMILANYTTLESIAPRVYVFKKPVLRENLTDQIVSNTGSKTLTFSADTEGGGIDSNYIETYTWLIDGEEKQSGPNSGFIQVYIPEERRSIAYPTTSFTINGSSLTVGIHTLSLRITSTAPNNVTATTEYSAQITVENNTVPSFTTGLSSFDLFSNRTKTITVSASDAITYTWSIDGTTKQTSADPSFIVDGKTLSAGEHTLKVVATNANGTASSETTFMVNPVILASVAKNSQNNIINFPAGYLLRDAPGLTYTDVFGSYAFDTAAGKLTYSPATGITGVVDALTMYSPTNPMAFATIVISILEYPVITQGLAATLALRQNESKLVSVTAESATIYKWFIDSIEKQSSASNSFTVDGASLTLGDHTLRVDAINTNGTASSSSTVSVSASLPPPDAPINILSQLESLTNIKISWTSTELVQYSLNDAAFVNASGSSLNISVIEADLASPVIPGATKKLVPQFTNLKLRAINQNGTSNIVSYTVAMPYTIEKRPINFGGVTDQYHITGFYNAGSQVSIVSGITNIADQADTRGDLSIQTVTNNIVFATHINAIGAEAFKNCSALESMSFVGEPPVFTNFVGSTGYWNFFPNLLPAKVAINYDSTITEWAAIVNRDDHVSPYIEFSAPPFIYEQLPATASVKINTDYSVEAKVNGSPLSYQWFKDGVAISGATNKTLTVNENVIGSASYKYTVSNTKGSLTSSEIVITFYSPPVITSELPTDVALLDACSNLISMSVSGTPEITYEWSINGSPVAGQTSATLTLTGAMLPLLGSNQLSFKATNIHGSDTKTVTVQKVAPPTITGGITDITLNKPFILPDTASASIGEGRYILDMVDENNVALNTIKPIYIDVSNSSKTKYKIALIESNYVYNYDIFSNPLPQPKWNLTNLTSDISFSLPSNSVYSIQKLIDSSYTEITKIGPITSTNFITNVYTLLENSSISGGVIGNYKIVVINNSNNTLVTDVEPAYFIVKATGGYSQKYTLTLLNETSNYKYYNYNVSSQETINISWKLNFDETKAGSLPIGSKVRIQKILSEDTFNSVYFSEPITEYTGNTFSANIVGTGPFTYEWKDNFSNSVGSDPTLTLSIDDFDVNGIYIYTLTVTNAYGSFSYTFNATVEKGLSNEILSFTANYGDIITESYTNKNNKNYTRIATPGDVTFTIEVAGYPRQTIEWLVSSVDFYLNRESEPVVVETKTTSNISTSKEAFTYMRTYDKTPDVNEVIYARITNGDSIIYSNKIYIDTPPVLETGFIVYYGDTYTKQQYTLAQARQFYANYSSSQNYILLLNDIAVLQSYMTQRYPEYIPFYAKNCSFKWEFKAPADTSFTSLDLTADYITDADPAIPFMVVIERSKFPLLAGKKGECIFRCTTDYKNTNIIGRAESIRAVTAKIVDYELNASEELVKLAFGANSISIPTEVTKIADNFVMRSMELDGYLGNSYTGNARRIYNTSIGGEVVEQKINALKNITSIVLHKGITSIGENAFGYNEFRWQFPSQTATSLLPNLTSIIGMPPSATIQKDAFANCPNLEEVLFDTSA